MKIGDCVRRVQIRRNGDYRVMYDDGRVEDGVPEFRVLSRSDSVVRVSMLASYVWALATHATCFFVNWLVGK